MGLVSHSLVPAPIGTTNFVYKCNFKRLPSASFAAYPYSPTSHSKDLDLHHYKLTIISLPEALSQYIMSSKIARRLIDIGANLTDTKFVGIYNSSQKHQNDFEHMLNRSKQNGVEKIIITGGTLDESKAALSIANRDDSLYSTVGCHPTRCNEFVNYTSGPDAYLDELRQLVQKGRNKIVAIGEMGLDYDRLHFCPKEIQKTYFELQLTLAAVTKLPLFLHNRNSCDDLIEILERNEHKFKEAGGVVHSFDGSSHDLDRILKLGLFIGINGCSLRTQQNLEVAQSIPADRLLIETDCPYCDIRASHASYKHVKTKFQMSKDASDPKLPVKNRNEPMTLIQVLEVLSSIRNEEIEKLSEQIYRNSLKLFFNK